jgi:hypothetical protein
MVKLTIRETYIPATDPRDPFVEPEIDVLTLEQLADYRFLLKWEPQRSLDDYYCN